MGLKTLLRGWLGVTKLETALAAVEERVVDEETIRQEIADALLAVFSGGRTRARYGPWYDYLEGHGGRFEQALRKLTSEQAKEATDAARSLVESRIDSEAFIDSLVARIRRKQLGV